jgi:hypothetical protein
LAFEGVPVAKKAILIASLNAVKLTQLTVIGLLGVLVERTPKVMDSWNIVKLTQPMVIGLLIGDSLKECRKSYTTHGNRPFREFLSQVNPW